MAEREWAIPMGGQVTAEAERRRERETCPRCGREGCVVDEKFVQATRREPMRSLGFQGYCPECECAYAA